MDKYTFIVDFIALSESSVEKSHKQQVVTAVLDLNSPTSQVHLIDIYPAVHLATAENTFFSSAHETFPRETTFWTIK